MRGARHHGQQLDNAALSGFAKEHGQILVCMVLVMTAAVVWSFVETSQRPHFHHVFILLGSFLGCGCVSIQLGSWLDLSGHPRCSADAFLQLAPD